jgi:hypothetical protein
MTADIDAVSAPDDLAALAADQLAFYDAVAEGFARATARVSTQEHDLILADFRVRLCFAGSALIPPLLPALEHLVVPADPAAAPDFRIALFDTRSTGTPLPFLSARFVELLRLRWWDYLAGRREIRGLNGMRIRSVFHLGPDILSLLDNDRNEAVYWIEDAAAIPYYETGYPLSVLLNWWLAGRGRYFVHAATIGRPDGGVLLTGKGGSGKSTTTLACLFSTLGIVGDDYAVVDPARAHAFSLYNSIKLKSLRDVGRFPGIADAVSNLARVQSEADSEDGEKALIFLHRHFPERLLPELPLKAILVPRIHSEAETRITPAPAALAFKALAPSTLFQLPGNAHDAFRALVDMVRRIPAYEIALGRDIARIPDRIEQFLTDPGR